MKSPYKNILNSIPSEKGIMGRYFKASVLVPFLEMNNKYYILFEKRAKGVRQESEICFPGGAIEENDNSPKAAAIRETSEELGLDTEKIIIDKENDLLVNAMGIIIYNFIGRLQIFDLQELKPNKDEVEKIFAVPVQFFLENEPEEYELRLEVQPKITDNNGNEKILFPAEQLGVPEKYAKPWSGKHHKVFVYRYKGEIIWGMTARILQSIFNKNVLKEVYT